MNNNPKIYGFRGKIGPRTHVNAFSGKGVTLGGASNTPAPVEEPMPTPAPVPTRNRASRTNHNSRSQGFYNYYNNFSGRGKTLGALASMNEHKTYKKVGNSYFGRKKTDDDNDEEEMVGKGEEETCIICYEKEPVALFDPCNHGGYCQWCVTQLKNYGKCPVCKNHVDNIVYFKKKEDGGLDELYTKDFYE